MLRFQYTDYLVALAILPLLAVLYFYVIRQKKNTIKKIGDEQLVKNLINNYSPKKFKIKYWLITIAIALGIIAIANPRKSLGNSPVNRKGIDVMIALDVSKSMLAQDVKPNRLERAKQLIAKLIDKLPEDRIGIVLFAGRAYLQMPLTNDHAAAKMYLSSASPDVVPTQGTVIGDALKMCFSSFSGNEKKYRSIIIISDGEDHDQKALQVAEAIGEEGVMINTVGIGSPEGTTIVDQATNELKKDAEGNVVITKLNEVGLKEMAAKATGIYQHFNEADEVAINIQNQLKTLGQKSITENSSLAYSNYFQWFLGTALFLLLIEFFMTERKKIVVEKQTLKKASTALIFLSLLFLSTAACCQTENELLKKGDVAYAKNEFKDAAEQYKKASEKNKGSDRAIYNLGNALYKNGESEEAIAAYEKAIKISTSNTEKAAAWYNKGVVYHSDKKNELAVEAYKNALRLNPADEEARHNLQLLLEQKKKQAQKKENKQPRKNNEKTAESEKKQKDKPKPQPSKMTNKEAQEKLKALSQKEKNLQDKLRKVDVNSPFKPEKDW